MTENTTKTTYVCTRCGAGDVYSDAWVGINDSTDIITFDQSFCASCEGECSVETLEEWEAKVSPAAPGIIVRPVVASEHELPDWFDFDYYEGKRFDSYSAAKEFMRFAKEQPEVSYVSITFEEEN
jgi:hypothetical protein